MSASEPLPDPLAEIGAALDAAEAVGPGPEQDFDGLEPEFDNGEHYARARDVIEAPGDMPVQCLGLNGSTYYYLDGLQQLRPLAAKDHSRSYIVSLFARHEDYLLSHWGRESGGKVKELTGGLHTDVISNILMRACAMEGVIDAARQVRGVGAWADDAGGLVLHLGDRVWSAGKYEPPARYGKHIYPAMPPMPRPAMTAQSSDAGVELLTDLESWHWRDPLMAQLVLGWVAQGYVAGALKWRTHIIGDGEAGSGKSTLKDLLSGLFREWMLGSSNLTEAGLRQTMQGKAHPVFLDEFEAGDNPQAKAKVVALLRQASSGGVVQRGGDDHKATEFSVQFPAFLTSITPVSLLAQDESRMVRLQLLPLTGATPLPDLSPTRLAKLGQRLMRRMLDQWPRFAATLAAYRSALKASAGFNDRHQDTYGTLLACADLLLHDHTPDAEELDATIEALARMVAPARAEAIDDQARCLAHLLQSPLDRGGGVKRSVASWVRDYRAMADVGGVDMARRREAERALGLIGLRVFDKGADCGGAGRMAQAMLFVANTHTGLQRLYQDTPWPGSAGAIGGWVTALRRIDGALVPPQSLKVGGQTQRGTLVPIEAVIDWGDDDA